MKKRLQTFSFRIFDIVVLSTLCGLVFILMRIQEAKFLESNVFNEFEAHKHLLNTSFTDFKFSVIFSIMLIPFIFFTKRTKYFIIPIFVFLIVLNAIFINYMITAYDLLGSEMFQFKFDEILFIISTERDAFSLFDVILYFVYPILFIVISILYFKYAERVNTKVKYLFVFLYLIFVIASAVDYKYYFPMYSHFDSYRAFALNNNKISYFAADSYHYFTKKYAKKSTSTELEKIILDYQNENPQFEFESTEFPFMHYETHSKHLSPYFKHESIKPNIVYILVESLSRSFSGPDAYLGSFTPFLDSLQGKSLYWENFLANAERTYGVLPNTLSSAPFFDSFMTNKPYVKYNSIIKELKKYDYYSSFDYGCWVDFSSMGDFLKSNKIDIIHDENTFDTLLFTKHQATEEDFHWGFDDEALLKQNLIHLENIPEPYLSVLLTISMHSPFDVNPNFTIEDVKNYYGNTLTKKQTELLKNNPDAIKSVAFTDIQLKIFFENYKKRADFKNTIFVISGDHNMQMLPLKNELDVFHVPLMIYSDLLTQSKDFKALATHREIAPSILGLLEENFNMPFQKNKHWLGFGLDTASIFRTEIITAMSLNSNKKISYLHKNRFVFATEVYQYDSLLNVKLETNPDTIAFILQKKEDYIKIEKYIKETDKLYK